MPTKPTWISGTKPPRRSPMKSFSTARALKSRHIPLSPVPAMWFLPEVGLPEIPVLPLQFYPPPQDSPQQALLRAVLDDAILTLTRIVPHLARGRNAVLFAETWEWLTS